MPTQQPEINQEPVSEILDEIRLAASVIVDQGSLIARLFSKVSPANLPIDICASLPERLPPTAGAGDCLLPISRVAQRWDVRHQAAWERLERFGTRVVQFGRNHYVRLSDLLEIEQKVSTHLKPFPSRSTKKRAERE